MPHSRNFDAPTKARLAGLCLAWLAEDPSAFPSSLREKLHVPLRRLASAVAALSATELLELKRRLLQLAMAGSLPGNVSVYDLYDFLNSAAVGEPP